MMVMRSRGQMQHVITFLLVAIVIVATLVVGVKLIGSVVSKSCDAEEARLESQLEEALITYDAYGTRQNVQFSAACKASAICFVSPSANPDAIRDAVDPAIPDAVRLQIASAAEAKTGSVFLVIDGTLVDVLHSPKVAINGDHLCIRREGNVFNILMEGRGRTIIISQP